MLGLRLARLACGKSRRALPAQLCENERTAARAAGQLPSQARGPTGMLRAAARYAELEAVRRRDSACFLRACSSTVSVLACRGDPVVWRPRHRRRLQRGQFGRCTKGLPAGAVVRRQAETRSTRLSRDNRRRASPAREPPRVLAGRSGRPAQHPHQRSISHLLQMDGEWPGGGGDRRLSCGLDSFAGR